MSSAANHAPGYAGPAGLDVDAAYQALVARDRRFDGRLWFGVTSTGVYCRPVCPAQTPKPANVRFFGAPAAAVSAGFRACKRCRPDSAPGSRHWDNRGDLASRALRLIADGGVDEEGVGGLARSLHVSERHLHRTLVAEVGAGPLQLAVSRRAQTARLLIEQTPLPLAEIAFAAGFSSIRQFNDVMFREFGAPPSELRRIPPQPVLASDPVLVLRLRLRRPYDAVSVGEFLEQRTVACLERHQATDVGWTHRRVMSLGPRTAIVEVRVVEDHVVVRSDADIRDTAILVRRVRRWLDLDADPETIDSHLTRDSVLRPLIAARPGLRVPGTVDSWETVVRAIVGQQVSVAGARTILGRIVESFGSAAAEGFTGFPSALTLADVAAEDISVLGMPRSRGRTIHAMATAVADGTIDLRSGDLAATTAVMLELPGIGPWTASYVRLRALADPDAFPSTDLGVRQAAFALGLPRDPRQLAERALAWSPWRSYATQHLWTSLSDRVMERPGNPAKEKR